MKKHIKTAIIQPPPPDPYPATHGIAWIPQLTIIWEVVHQPALHDINSINKYKVKKCNSYCISTAFFYPVHTRTAVDKQLFHSIRQNVQARGRTKQIKGVKKDLVGRGLSGRRMERERRPSSLWMGKMGWVRVFCNFFGYGEKLNWEIVKIPHNQKKKPYKF